MIPTTGSRAKRGVDAGREASGPTAASSHALHNLYAVHGGDGLATLSSQRPGLPPLKNPQAFSIPHGPIKPMLEGGGACQAKALPPSPCLP